MLLGKFPVTDLCPVLGVVRATCLPNVKEIGDDQLEDHRQPLPLTEELLQKLGRRFGYSKVNSADAYHQIKLSSKANVT